MNDISLADLLVRLATQGYRLTFSGGMRNHNDLADGVMIDIRRKTNNGTLADHKLVSLFELSASRFTSEEILNDYILETLSEFEELEG